MRKDITDQNSLNKDDQAIDDPILATPETTEDNQSSLSLTPSIVFILVALLAILVLAGYFRFTGLNWDDTYHLHPDERFLTDVASLLKSTDPITYLRTSESPLNPYNVGKTFYVYGNFPMTLTRLAAEGAEIACQSLGDVCDQHFLYFDGIQFIGRFLSGLLDLVSILFIFLIGKRLYNWRVGLLSALLLAMAVLPIQQSHFFTLDNWAAALTTVTMYGAVRTSQDAGQKRWWLFFGVGLGLTAASRINLAPLALMAVVAAFIWLANRASKQEDVSFWRYPFSQSGNADFLKAIIGVFIAAIVSIVVFRVAQPYAFADSKIIQDTALFETGELPGILETAVKSVISFNPQWRANMAEIQGLQSPDASFPPALQWTSRTPIIFPLTNIVFWGLGITAGIMAIVGFVWAVWRIIRVKPEWSAHLLIVSWIGMYFLFMATRWVKSIRYFLPIYPFLLLLAAWALIELYRLAGENRLRKVAALFVIAVVVLSTFLWANAFMNIYRMPVTRVEASAWMFENIPTGATLLYETSDQQTEEMNLPLRRYDFLPGGPPLLLQFIMPEDASLKGVRFNYLSLPETTYIESKLESLKLDLMEIGDNQPIAQIEGSFELNNRRQAVTFDLPDLAVSAGNAYALVATAGPESSFSAGTSIIANEHWDDPLPVRYEGLDPYSSYYEGISEGLIPITIPDSEEKRQSFYRWLDGSDYIVLSSQRALWSLPRLPLTFPLTTSYYEALFSGELGFELVNQFHANINIGPLNISDVAGAVNFGSPVSLGWPPPGLLAAEEAFSVYDHPPVWIFEKNDEYSPKKVREVLGEVDLSNVIFMTPGQATKAANGLMLSEPDLTIQRINGTFSDIFAVDGLLSQQPWLAAIVWWLAVVVLGIIAFPIAFITLGGLPDKGYPLARILSLLIISYFGWITASLQLLPNTRNTLLLGLILMVIICILIAVLKRKDLVNYIRQNLALIGFVELLGIGLFLLFIAIRLGNPDIWDVIWGGEKPMDLSYFNAVLKSTVFPPYDPWFAGGYINYYYYGFVYVGALTKLLGIVPTVAYNLIIPMLAAFTGLGAFSIAYNLVVKSSQRRQSNGDPNNSMPVQKSTRKLSVRGVAAGLIAALFIILIGNLAEVGVVLNAWYQAGDPVVSTGIAHIDTVLRTADGGLDLALTSEVAPIYPGDWFWTATRAISVEPGEVQPITEFPFFTFLYGDLHAHMIALPLTLLSLAWAISLVLPGIRYRDGRKSLQIWEILLIWLVGALAAGVLRATNTWDYPTYLFIGSLSAAYFVYQFRGRIDIGTIGLAAFAVVSLIALSTLLFLPFVENYGLPYSSFSLWTGSYTPLSNYLIIYGLFLLFVITFLVFEFRSWTKTWTQKSLSSWEPFVIPVFLGLLLYVGLSAFLLLKGYWIAPLVLLLVLTSGLLALQPLITIERRIVLFLISGALFLTLIVEFIVLDGDIGRMNTVFKFYLQVWVLLSIASAVIAVWVWPAIMERRTIKVVWTVLLGLLLAAAFLYPILATKAKWDIRMSDEAPATLDGMAFMKTTSYEDAGPNGISQTINLDFDYQAIQWMQRNIEGSPVIAEAHGKNPYRAAANRVSMYTGLPTIVGWDWHQRQQRALLPASIVGDRIFDVDSLYNTIDLQEAMGLIGKYDVSYVYVGPLEWTYYNPQGLVKFDQMVEAGLLREVYRNEGVSIYEVIP